VSTEISRILFFRILQFPDLSIDGVATAADAQKDEKSKKNAFGA
jgi:hypothetical protein